MRPLLLASRREPRAFSCARSALTYTGSRGIGTARTLSYRGRVRTLAQDEVKGEVVEVVVVECELEKRER